MGLLTPTRRVYHRWQMVMPLYDGRQCPDCAAVIFGREARRLHREWHMAAEEWRQQLEAIIRQIATYAGMTVVEAEPRRQADEVTHVDLRAPDYDDDEDEDDE